MMDDEDSKVVDAAATEQSDAAASRGNQNTTAFSCDFRVSKPVVML